MKIVKKIAKIISTIVLSFLCLISLFILVFALRIGYLTTQNRVGEIKLNFYTILTQSMYPNIKAGDMIITYKNVDGKYKKGDVITFISAGKNSSGITITHRIKDVYKEEDTYYYITKGDNNNVEDSVPVPSGNVLGRVVVKIPKAGYIQQFLVTKTGWVVVILLPCLCIAIYDVLKLFRIVGKKKDIDKPRKKDKRLILGDNDIPKTVENNDFIDNQDNNSLDVQNINKDDRLVIDIPDSNAIENESFDDQFSNYNNELNDNIVPLEENEVVESINNSYDQVLKEEAIENEQTTDTTSLNENNKEKELEEINNSYDEILNQGLKEEEKIEEVSKEQDNTELLDDDVEIL